MSLKGSEYETAEEAAFRLAETIVTYDGEPVYITTITEEQDLPKGDIFRVHFRRLPLNKHQDTERKFISSGKFDLTPLRLGFVNYGGNCFYISRTTARQNKQGFNARTMNVSPLPGLTDVSAPRFNNLLSDENFFEMLKGKYPAVEDAVKKLQIEEAKSVAISREYALRAHETLEDLLILYNKQVIIGFMEPEDKLFRIGKKFTFLKEELAERNIPFKM